MTICELIEKAEIAFIYVGSIGNARVIHVNHDSNSVVVKSRESGDTYTIPVKNILSVYDKIGDKLYERGVGITDKGKSLALINIPGSPTAETSSQSPLDVIDPSEYRIKRIKY